MCSIKVKLKPMLKTVPAWTKIHRWKLMLGQNFKEKQDICIVWMHLSPMNINHSVFSFKSQILCYSSLQEVKLNTPPFEYGDCDHLKMEKPWNRTGPPTMSSAYLLPVENFNQKVSLIREVKNAETKENSLRRLNNNNVIIKHSQGPLALSQGL